MATTETTQATYLIPGCNIDMFEAKVAQLNKRARKLKVPQIEVSRKLDHVAIGAYQPQYQPVGSGAWANNRSTEFVWLRESDIEANQNSALPAQLTDARLEFWSVTITGEAPVLPGWEFMATLEPIQMDKGFENLIRNVPGKETPERFRTYVFRCDHCQTRRRRKETFVVRKEETGEYLAVGRQCIKDFLGGECPHNIAQWMEWLKDVELLGTEASDPSWAGEGNGMTTAWNLEDFLAQTAAVIAVDGWLSRSKAFDWGAEPTADTVTRILSASRDDRENPKWIVWASDRKPGLDHKEEAKEALEWAKNMETNGNSYLANLKLIARAGYVNFRSAGFAASMIIAYQKHQDRAAKQAADEKRKETAEEVPEGRLEITGEVISTKDVFTDFGAACKMLVQDDRGFRVWGTMPKSIDAVRGDRVTLTGTVKRSDDDKFFGFYSRPSKAKILNQEPASC